MRGRYTVVPSVTRDPQKSDTITTTDAKTGAKRMFDIPKASANAALPYAAIFQLDAGRSSGGQYIRGPSKPGFVA
jgi:hypothetical protein